MAWVVVGVTGAAIVAGVMVKQAHDQKEATIRAGDIQEAAIKDQTKQAKDRLANEQAAELGLATRNANAARNRSQVNNTMGGTVLTGALGLPVTPSTGAPAKTVLGL